MSGLLSRIAGGPITWGVTGSPDTSHQMDRDRVLQEMADVGLSATVDEAEWTTLLTNLRGLEDLATAHGLRTALHPHWGMAIEQAAHVDRVMASSDVGLCLDTGHLYLGGADPVELARRAPERVVHVHLKDVDAELAEHLRGSRSDFDETVRRGLFTPLGQGAVDVAGVVEVLEQYGFDGWYVLEQDTAFDTEPAAGEGPVVDARRSVEFLESLAPA